MFSVRARGLAAALGVAVVAGCHAAPVHRGPVARSTFHEDGHCLSAARQLFYAAVDGDAGSLRAFVEALKECAAEPAKLSAYRGGCRLLEAARAPLPWEKGRLTREGLALLDDAVRRSPDDLEVRFVRGMSGYHLPRFVGREATAASDLAAVAAEAEEATRTGRLDVAAACAALFYDGQVLDRQGDCTATVAAWRRAAAVGPDTSAGKAAARAIVSAVLDA